MSEKITMGEATKLAQGHPTQIWVPAQRKHGVPFRAALIHDRSQALDNPGIFFIPGNKFENIFEAGAEEQDIVDEGGSHRRLRIPNSLLWSNHGGPCESRGAKYRRLNQHLMARVYEALEMYEGQKPIELPMKAIRTNQDYTGPFDYVLPSQVSRTSEKPKLEVMNPELFR